MKKEENQNNNLPKNWELKQIEEIVMKTEQINPIHLPGKFEYIDVSSISREFLRIENTTSMSKQNAPGRARKPVKTGDVIIATVRPTLKRLAFIEKEYNNQICSTAFCVLRNNPDLIENRYLFYAIQQPYIYEILKTMQGGASYPAVTDKNIRSLFIPLPSKEEQKKIVAVLHEIQKAIETQDAIIKTTQELKKSTMQYLFTHGLYGEKTRESPIGKIPESWGIGTLKDLCDIISDTCLPSNNSELVYIGLEHMDTASFFLNRVGSPKDVVSSKNKFAKNDVLYGKLRPYLDKAVVAESDGICSTDILVFRPKKNIPPLFLLGILHSSRFIDYAIQTTHGVNHPRTSWKSLQFYELGVPLIKEQQKIGDTLNIIEQEIVTHISKRTCLQKLFNSMLNRLMIGELRINNLTNFKKD